MFKQQKQWRCFLFLIQHLHLHLYHLHYWRLVCCSFPGLEQVFLLHLKLKTSVCPSVRHEVHLSLLFLLLFAKNPIRSHLLWVIQSITSDAADFQFGQDCFSKAFCARWIFPGGGLEVLTKTSCCIFVRRCYGGCLFVGPFNIDTLTASCPDFWNQQSPPDWISVPLCVSLRLSRSKGFSSICSAVSREWVVACVGRNRPNMHINLKWFFFWGQDFDLNLRTVNILLREILIRGFNLKFRAV